MKAMAWLGISLAFGLTCATLAQQGSSAGWAGAVWVWDQADAHQTPQSNDPRFLRRTFTLAGKPLKAELWITADNQYVAYVNGQKVGRDNEWNTVEKYDVAKHLTAGKNVLAIEARNQGGPAGIIARLHIMTADKKELFVVTDQQMKITQNAPKGWQDENFDDASWFAAIVLGDPSVGPWNLAGSPVANAPGSPGKGPNYGSAAVDASIKTRLSANEQRKHFIVPKDFEIELVAAEPVVINPITMVLDDKGRIIVSESHTYRYGPSGSPIKPFANPVVRLDTKVKGAIMRELVADGFDDPVMGIAVKGDKLWLTANNFLYTYDLPPSPPWGEGPGVRGGSARPEKGPPLTPNPSPQGGEGDKKPLATNKKTIVTDLNKAWNPFGMFVLEWGPDGKLYMSVGNHDIKLQGPDTKLSSRGGSGIIVRMNPDGTQMERLVHGLRVPYSFEYDPFGQLWLHSNGEGNPNRFVRVIEGVDYHCYSRGSVDNNWLAGNHPLAPPCEEVHRGAHTQLMRYYSAAYPAEFQGNLFSCNWGAHGFAGPNRGIFRYVLDDRNNVVTKDTLVTCTDPHFRPAHIVLDHDGNLLIADWYGRDDESDMTGRIWRLKYVGKDRPVVKHKLDSDEWKNDEYAISALGSPHHLIREKAMDEFVKRRDDAQLMRKLTSQFDRDDPLGAASALWALLRVEQAESKASARLHLYNLGAYNKDWKVRRLAYNLVRRYRPPLGEGIHVKTLAEDEHPAFRIEFALTASKQVRLLLREALEKGAASDDHLRYEAAWHFAKHFDAESLTKLLTAESADVRLAGLIAIDVACYENFATKKVALEALAKAIENPGKLDHQLLLTVAQLDGDASIVPALEKLIARDDVPTATVAKAVLVLKAKAGVQMPSLALRARGAGKRLIEAVETGALRIATPADQLILFEFLESEGPTPFALKQVGGQLQSGNKELRLAAHTLARRFGYKAAPLAGQLWLSVLNPKTKFEDAIESLSTIARVEGSQNRDGWFKLLDHEDPNVRMETVRWWRQLPGKLPFDMTYEAKTLLAKDARVADDLGMVALPSNIAAELKLPGPEKNKDALTKYALDELAKIPAADRPKRAAMGLQVFERNACTKCHTTATQTTLLAPSLKGIAAQKIDYLIESVLFPSKIIKTGFESETVTTADGKVHRGLVKDEGDVLRVLDQDKDTRIPKSQVESRAQSKISIMPEGQEAQLSRREFVDLIAYLATLK